MNTMEYYTSFLSSTHNSSLKIAYSEEYDNHFNVLVLGYLLTDEQNCFEAEPTGP